MISFYTAVIRFYENIKLGNDKKIRHSIEYLESRNLNNYWDKSVKVEVKKQKKRLKIK